MNNVFETVDPQKNFKTVSNSGLTIKTLIGLFIAFAVALPNLFSQRLFLSHLYYFEGVTFFVVAIVVTAVVGLVWAALFKMLRTDHGPLFNTITYIVTSALAGLFLGNALVIAVMIIGLYADISNTILYQSLLIATGATFIAVVGSVAVLPLLKMDGAAIRFFGNAAKLVISMTFVSGIMLLVGYGLSLTGNYLILELYYNLAYGLGPLSIIFTGLCIIAAEFVFLVTLARSKQAVGTEPKYLEYFYAIILVNAIIRIYVETFKLALKILAKNSRK